MASVGNLTAAATLTGAAVSCTVLAGALRAPDGSMTLFAWHPTLMIASVSMFAPSAMCVAAMRKESSASRKQSLGTAHAVLHAGAVGCAVAAAAAIYSNKAANGKPHLTSIHSGLGAGALAAVIGSAALQVAGPSDWQALATKAAFAMATVALASGIGHPNWTPPGLSAVERIQVGLGIVAAPLAALLLF